MSKGHCQENLLNRLTYDCVKDIKQYSTKNT